MEEIKYYETKGFTILLLLFFFPLGIYFMFKYQHFTSNIRIGVSVFFGVLFLFSLISDEEPNDDILDTSAGDINENIVDTEKPIIEVDNSAITIIIGEPITLPTCRVTDNIDENLNCVFDETNVNYSVAGTYRLYVNSEDLSGNKADEVSITVIVEEEDNTVYSIPSTFTASKGTTVTLDITGRPNTTYSIQVNYKSGPSDAEGLDNKISDINGDVSWTWEIGSRTTSGTWIIVINELGSSKSWNIDFIVN